jgi:hypothetical protein
MPLSDVTLISHADWSINPSKRWVAIATLQPDHHWRVVDLLPAFEPGRFLHTLQAYQPSPGCVLAGFDFPIGLPIAYANRLVISDFLSVLPLFGHAEWEQFYSPCASIAEISLHRPFYPARPSNARRSHLENGLSLPFAQLYRLCEVAHNSRRSACPLFWTLGGQQVGKATITGWRDLLAPALADHSLNLKLWPFSGPISQCCLPGNCVVVETYPSEFYSHLGLSFSTHPPKSKRRYADRLSFAPTLLTWADEHSVELHPSIRSAILDGFGNDYSSEDRFDALVGLYGMINVVQDHHPTGEPLVPHISAIEGWIFGQTGYSN